MSLDRKGKDCPPPKRVLLCFLVQRWHKLRKLPALFLQDASECSLKDIGKNTRAVETSGGVTSVKCHHVDHADIYTEDFDWNDLEKPCNVKKITTHVPLSLLFVPRQARIFEFSFQILGWLKTALVSVLGTQPFHDNCSTFLDNAIHVRFLFVILLDPYLSLIYIFIKN